LEKILEAYKRIAEHLPRIDTLHTVFGKEEDFQRVLGYLYKDLAEFHRRVYKIVRRRGWAILFHFDWGNFEYRFKSLLTSMACRFDLVDTVTTVIPFDVIKKVRDIELRQYEKDEQQRMMMISEAVHNWLSAAENEQEEHLERLANKRQPVTCNWILDQNVIRSWLEASETEPLIWLTGIPGSGKSVLASFIIQHLQSRKDSTVLYFFCAVNSAQIGCADVLRTMAFQALQQNPDMASLVHEAYLTKVSARSAPKMTAMLKHIFSAVKFVHIIVDGVDECGAPIQQDILKALLEVQRNSDGVVKILISSRLERQISQRLTKKTHISLNGQTDGAMELYIAQEMKELVNNFPTISQSLLTRIERRMLDMAHGMFLWVYLVTVMLKNQATERELEEALEQFPEGLDAAYGRILHRLESLKGPKRKRVYDILSWLCVVSRPVTAQEVADGIVLQSGQAGILNEKTRIRDTEKDVIDVCAPLVEKNAEGHLEIVHFSAKEFLLSPQSGPVVDIVQAHFNVAFSCVSSLNSSFVVLPRFSSQTTTSEIEILMVRGYFGLHAYAHQYWAYHVTKYFQTNNSFGKSTLPGCDTTALVRLLETFSRVLKGSLVPDDLSSPHSIPSTTTKITQLSQSPQISDLIKKWMDFRSQMAKSETNAGTIEDQLSLELRQDPTFLSLIAQKIRSIKEDLLKLDLNNIPGHINPEEYMDFKKEVGTCMFECRYGSCNHYSNTPEQRLKHEKNHRRSFHCLHCDFSGIGFKSRRDLERHIKVYHREDENTTIPGSLSCGSDRGQSAINPTKMLHYSPLSSREPDGWNEKGRKALQSILSQVFKALALQEVPLAGRVSSNVPSASLGDLASDTAPSSIFAVIGRKIEAGEYQNLRNFTHDINNFFRSIKSQNPADDLTKIQNTLDTILDDAMYAYPGFACSQTQDPLQHRVEHNFSTGPENLFHSRNSLDFTRDNEITRSRTELGRKPIFWSKIEESELPGLLSQYGRRFSQIADILNTKTAEDVEERFQLLVSSGRQDLAELVSLAEARLCKERDKDNAMMIDTNLHELSTSSPINEAAEHADLPNGRRSREQSARPVQVFPDSTDAVPFLPPSETVPAYPIHRQKRTLNPTAKKQLDQTTNDDKRPKKYIRRAPPPAYCYHCINGPKKLRDEHTLLKHIARFHSPFRKAWICIDVSIDKKMLANCHSCKSGMRYRAKHNAAIHLRNKHFGPRASMEALTRWMEEVEEPNPNHSGSQPGLAASAGKYEKLPSVSFWSAPGEDRVSETGEEGASKEIPLLEVSFDNILQGYSGRTTPDVSATPRPNQERIFDSSIPHLAHQGLIRVDHVDRLPNLSGPRKAVTRDQVVAYYHILSESDIKSKRYEEALENLKGLSQRLLKDLRDWRRDLTAAPEIRPSF
jgi:hypothetical protein